MNQFFTDGKLNEDSLRGEILRTMGLYCQNRNLPVPEPCKKVINESTPEQLAETEINLINTEYLLEE